MKRLAFLLLASFVFPACNSPESADAHSDAATPWASQSLAYQQHFESEARAQRAFVHVSLRCCGTSDRIPDTVRKAALDSVHILADLDYPPAQLVLSQYYFADTTELSLQYLRRAAELGLPTAIEDLQHYEEFISSGAG